MQSKSKILIGLATVLVFTVLPALSFAAVELKAECAYSDTEVECDIFADAGSDTLISGGVGLNYDGTELGFESAEKNETEWFFGDGTKDGNFPYMDPEDVAESGDDRAVLTVVGKLKESAPDEGIDGDRIKIVNIKFSRKAGSSPPFDLTLGLARGGAYENFVATDGTLLDDGISEKEVVQAERGDSNADGSINAIDAQVVTQIFFGNSDETVFADCNGDGDINAIDAQCITQKFFGN